jgi:hypothetical protein
VAFLLVVLAVAAVALSRLFGGLARDGGVAALPAEARGDLA